MEEFAVYFPYLLTFVGLYGIVLIIGILLLALFERGNENPVSGWLRLFYNLLAGTTALVFVFAAFKTGGNTIFVLTPLLAAFLILQNRKTAILLPFSVRIRNSITLSILYKSIFLLGIFVFFSLPLFYSHLVYDGSLVSLPGDKNFYSRLSAFINNTGIENYTLNSSAKGATPYHYYELWLNAFAATVFNKRHYFAFHFVTIHFLAIILLSGLCALMEELGITGQVKKSAFNTLALPALAFGLLFFTGLYLPFLKAVHPVFESLQTFQLNLIFPKLLPATIFLLAAMLFYLRGQYNTCLLTFLFIPVVTIATAPAIFGVLGLAFVALLLFSRQTLRQPIVYFAVAFTVLFGAFFIVNSQMQKTLAATTPANIPSPVDILIGFTNPLFIKTFINIIAGTLITLPFLFVAFFIAFLLAYTSGFRAFKRNLFVILVYLGLNLVALVTWAFLHKMLDSAQLFQIVVIPTTFLLIALFSAQILAFFRARQGSSTLAYLSVGFIGITFIAPFIIHFIQEPNKMRVESFAFGKSYIEQVERYFTKDETEAKFGVILNNVTDKKNVFIKNLNIQWPGATYLPGISDKVYLTSLSILDIPRTKDQEQREYGIESAYIKNSAFYNYCLSAGLEDSYYSNKQETKLSYIRSRPELDFVIVEKEYQGIVSKLPYKQIFQDSLSGQSFVVL